ncbi:MAG: ATP-binding protein [Thermoplasmata archaeon]|nr:MAG: ATP-binding protein [Thermoplasmata archaeon]
MNKEEVTGIGEVVSASVLSGLEVKLALDNPEDLRIGYPAIVEGKKYDFYCMVHDIINEKMEIAERLAGSNLKESVVPVSDLHEGYGGRIFYSKAKLKPIQLIEKGSGKLSEPETIPPYFSETRHASKSDVEKLYEVTPSSAPIGSLRGVAKFDVNIDFGKLVKKPFGIFGRTGSGKSIFNKILCTSILARNNANILIFDMHSEYGIYSKTDNTEGLKFFFPEKVEIFSLDFENKEAKPFIISPKEIRPADIIVAFQDLSGGMIDALFAVNRHKSDLDLVTAIQNADPEDFREGELHPTSLSALQRRIARIDRFQFVRETESEAFGMIQGLVKAGKSIVLDFGRYGTNQMAYLFVANVLARRFFDLYTEHNEDYPRLVIFLEEAHKFLEPGIAQFTIFDRLARETRKFNLILALIDQRPSRIDDEVRSQLANRLVLSLKEPSDMSSALAGVPDRSAWENIVGTIPPRTVVVFGDAIRVPTVIDVMHYNAKNVKRGIIGDNKDLDGVQIKKIAEKADEIFG